MAFDKSKYDQQYSKLFVTKKLIPFNKLKKEDVELLQWIEAQEENATQYVKRLVREDMNKKKNLPA